MAVRVAGFRTLSEDVLDYAAELQGGGRDGVAVLLGWWARANPGLTPPDTFQMFALRPDGLWENVAAAGEQLFCEAEILDGGGAARCGDPALIFLAVRPDRAVWATALTRLDGSDWFAPRPGPEAGRGHAVDALLRLAPASEGPAPRPR